MPERPRRRLDTVAGFELEVLALTKDLEESADNQQDLHLNLREEREAKEQLGKDLRHAEEVLHTLTDENQHLEVLSKKLDAELQEVSAVNTQLELEVSQHGTIVENLKTRLNDEISKRKAAEDKLKQSGAESHLHGPSAASHWHSAEQKAMVGLLKAGVDGDRKRLAGREEEDLFKTQEELAKEISKLTSLADKMRNEAITWRDRAERAEEAAAGEHGQRELFASEMDTSKSEAVQLRVMMGSLQDELDTERQHSMGREPSMSRERSTGWATGSLALDLVPSDARMGELSDGLMELTDECQAYHEELYLECNSYRELKAKSLALFGEGECMQKQLSEERAMLSTLEDSERQDQEQEQDQEMTQEDAVAALGLDWEGIMRLQDMLCGDRDTQAELIKNNFFVAWHDFVRENQARVNSDAALLELQLRLADRETCYEELRATCSEEMQADREICYEELLSCKAAYCEELQDAAAHVAEDSDAALLELRARLAARESYCDELQELEAEQADLLKRALGGSKLAEDAEDGVERLCETLGTLRGQVTASNELIDAQSQELGAMQRHFLDLESQCMLAQTSITDIERASVQLDENHEEATSALRVHLMNEQEASPVELDKELHLLRHQLSESHQWQLSTAELVGAQHKELALLKEGQKAEHSLMEEEAVVKEEQRLVEQKVSLEAAEEQRLVEQKAAVALQKQVDALRFETSYLHAECEEFSNAAQTHEGARRAVAQAHEVALRAMEQQANERGHQLEELQEELDTVRSQDLVNLRRQLAERSSELSVATLNHAGELRTLEVVNTQRGQELQSMRANAAAVALNLQASGDETMALQIQLASRLAENRSLEVAGAERAEELGNTWRSSAQIKFQLQATQEQSVSLQAQLTNCVVERQALQQKFDEISRWGCEEVHAVHMEARAVALAQDETAVEAAQVRSLQHWMKIRDAQLERIQGVMSKVRHEPRSGSPNGTRTAAEMGLAMIGSPFSEKGTGAATTAEQTHVAPRRYRSNASLHAQSMASLHAQSMASLHAQSNVSLHALQFDDPSARPSANLQTSHFSSTPNLLRPS